MRSLKDFNSSEDAVFLAVLQGDVTLQEFRNLWQENRALGYSEGYDEGWATGLDQAQWNAGT